MVDTDALCTAFGRTGLNGEMQDALVRQGLNSILDLCLFKSEDMIHLCKAVRHES